MPSNTSDKTSDYDYIQLAMVGITKESQLIGAIGCFGREIERTYRIDSNLSKEGVVRIAHYACDVFEDLARKYSSAIPYSKED